jgi:hypothetical protein
MGRLTDALVTKSVMDVASVRVDKRLYPRARTRILDLHDMREVQRAVVECEELEGRRVLVEGAVEGVLGDRNGILEGDGRDGGWDVRCGRSEYRNLGREEGSLGFTNEEPKATTLNLKSGYAERNHSERTLSSLLKATLATAFATGIPS